MRFLAARRIPKWKECARRKAEHPEERCVRPRRRPHRGGPRPRRREAGRCVASGTSVLLEDVPLPCALGRVTAPRLGEVGRLEESCSRPPRGGLNPSQAAGIAAGCPPVPHSSSPRSGLRRARPKGAPQVREGSFRSWERLRKTGRAGSGCCGTAPPAGRRSGGCSAPTGSDALGEPGACTPRWCGSCGRPGAVSREGGLRRLPPGELDRCCVRPG